MTEQEVEKIEQHSKTQLDWEKFVTDIEYLKKKQQWDMYESKLIEELAKDPHHTGILEYLADFYMMDNQKKKALPLYKKLVDQTPNNHIYMWKMAQVYVYMKDYETAEVLLDNALTLHPDTPKYAMTLVELYYHTERIREAVDLMEQIVQRRPENLSYRTTLVSLYEETHEDEKVVATYEAMVTIDPTNAKLKRKLLEARTRLNR